MAEYPRNALEMEKMYATQESCMAYLERLKWPPTEEFVCPMCGCSKAWRTSSGGRLCGGCRYRQSVTGGTIFQDTHLPLTTWFRAMWHICANKNGVSAQNLQRLLGLRSYNTAWLCLHKLRRAMVRPGRERLSGIVEADETYLGGPREGKRGRGAFGKQIVMIAVEVRGSKAGRVRLIHVPNVSGEVLEGALNEAVQEGTLVRTDGWLGYSGIGDLGYMREVAAPGEGEMEDVVLPKCHLLASLLKRWILGTLQGNVGRDHLQDYLNEFTFRFNRRTSRSRGLLFYRLAQMAVSAMPNPRCTIVPRQGGSL